MLTKTQRDEIIADLKTIDFEYDGWDNPDLPDNIYRLNERKKVEDTQITVRFYPVSGGYYKSITNAIDWKLKGKYVQFGYCQPENVEIISNVVEFVNDYNISGRDYAYFLMQKVLTHIMKKWDNGFLRQYGASLASTKHDVNISDETINNPRTGKKLYRYGIDVLLKTQFNWDHAPDVIDKEEGVVKQVSYGMQGNIDFKIISDK